MQDSLRDGSSFTCEVSLKVEAINVHLKNAKIGARNAIEGIQNK